MSKRFNHPLIAILLVVAVILSACNLPKSQGQPTSDPNAVFTAAAQTLAAQLTQSAPLASSTPENMATLPPANTQQPSPTVAVPSPTPRPPTPTNTPLCDLSQFIKDVSIPDGAEFAPGAAFTKTWRIKNIGVCTWSGYSLVFDTGDSMGGPASVAIGSVSPGQEVDLSVDLKAPSTDGKYRGYWRVRNAAGVLIPVAGGYQGKSFYVDIKVVAATATPTATPTTTPASNVSVNLNAAAGNTGGTVYEPGGDPVELGSINAGDTAANKLARGFMSFNISALNGKTIVSAKLKLDMCSVQNDPFTNLGGIWVGEVQFTPPLEQSYYDVAGTGITKLTATPDAAGIDVKSLIQTRVTEGKTYFQVRLRPVNASDGNSTVDALACGAGDPVLVIVYQP